MEEVRSLMMTWGREGGRRERRKVKNKRKQLK
jgi:hypothetical protein